MEEHQAKQRDGFLLSKDKRREVTFAQSSGFQSLPDDPLFPCTVGISSLVAKKNRYKNIVPYDHNRVMLTTTGSTILVEDEDDYINASYIRGYTSTDGYIVTQGPMLGTLEDFWSMVWSQNAQLVVMMSRLVEHCQNQSYRYWPDVGSQLEVDELTVTTESETVRAGFESRVLVLENRQTEETRRVTQVQLMAWPENSMPCLQTFVAFWRQFKKEKKLGPDRPPVIHSSDGSQRCGVLMALDILMNQWEAAMSPCLDLHNCVLRLREDRMNLVASEEEYNYIQQLVKEAISTWQSHRPIEAWLPTAQRSIQDGQNDLGGGQSGFGGEWDTILLEEYDNLRQSTFGVLQRNKCNFVNNNDMRRHSNIFSEDLLPDHCFSTGLENVTVSCVPIHHRSVTRSEDKMFRMRRSVSIQEHTEAMGLGGVLPPQCRRSFLVMQSHDVIHSSEFWQMIFDTGCRTVVHLVPAQQDSLVKDSISCALVCSDLSITPLKATRLNDHVTEAIATLNSSIVPIPTVDCETVVNQPIKIISLNCTSSVCTGSETDAMLFVFELVHRWLDQTSSALVAVNGSEGSCSIEWFCSAFNVTSDLQAEKAGDVLLTTKEVHSTLHTLVSWNEYQNLHRLCREFARRHQHDNNNSTQHQRSNTTTTTTAENSSNIHHTHVETAVEGLNHGSADDTDQPAHSPLSTKFSMESTCSES